MKLGLLEFMNVRQITNFLVNKLKGGPTTNKTIVLALESIIGCMMFSPLS